MSFFERSFGTCLDASRLDPTKLVVGSSGYESDLANGEASFVSRLELFPGVASFVEASSLYACSVPLMSLSSDLGCKTRVNLNFTEKWQNGKVSLQYMLQTWNFSRSRVTKRTSPLDLSCEI